MRRLYCIAGVLLLLALINPYAAKADTVGGFAWSGTVGGIPVSGTALFIVQGSASPYNLEIILSETSTTTPTSADDALAGLDFTISGQGTTALVMSTAASGAAGMFTSSGNTTGNNTAGTNICATGSYNAGAPPAGCNVTGGWEAGYTGTGFTGDTNAHWGIGTTTYTGGAYIAGDVGLDNYGIDPTVGDGTGVGNYPFVDGTATFVLTGVVLANPTISNVAGVYGADVGVLAGSSIPEPGTVATFAGGFLLLALARRRRQTR